MSTPSYNDLSREQLVALLERRDREAKRQRRFGLVWERDEIEREAALNADFVALEPDADLSCGAAPHGNLIVEGDNFDALRFLRMTHAGKVKCVYIDPPYNTGNRGWQHIRRCSKGAPAPIPPILPLDRNEQNAVR